MIPQVRGQWGINRHFDKLKYACLTVCSVVSHSLWPCGLQSARLLYLWNLPGKNTGVGCHFLLHILPNPGIKPTSPAYGVLLAPVAEVASRAERQGQGFTAGKRQGPPRLPCWAEGSRATSGPSRGLRASTAPAAGSPWRPGSPGSTLSPHPRALGGLHLLSGEDALLWGPCADRQLGPDPLGELLIQGEDVTTLHHQLGPILELDLVDVTGHRGNEFGPVKVAVSPPELHELALRWRAQAGTVSTSDALWIQVVAVGSVIKVHFLEGLRGGADDAAPGVKPVAVLGDDHLAQGHGPHDLDVMAPRLVLEAGDGDDVGPVIRLHEDAGGMGASHMEGGGTLPLCHQGIVNTVEINTSQHKTTHCFIIWRFQLQSLKAGRYKRGWLKLEVRLKDHQWLFQHLSTKKYNIDTNRAMVKSWQVFWISPSILFIHIYSGLPIRC